jgi:hypothetical protein
VRWTQQRNFEAALDMLADGRLDVTPLVSHRFALEETERAYAVVGGAEPSLEIVLEYLGGDSARLLGRTVCWSICDGGCTGGVAWRLNRSRGKISKGLLICISDILILRESDA